MKQVKILAVGDIVGPASVLYIKERLWRFRKENEVNLIVANAENACIGNGLDGQTASELLNAGADVLTSGNHIWHKRDIRNYLNVRPNVLRPANYPAECPGNGWFMADSDGMRFLVINVMGVIYMDPLDCPFKTIDKILKAEEGKYDFSVLDIHAESTSEKSAVAHCFDGKINVIFGTHTHVQTADEKIMPNGTGYITDVGMTGPTNSILGVVPKLIVEKLRYKMPVKFEIADGIIEVNCVLFTLDAESHRTVKIQRIKF
jgi:metallophosphoesterase (TIGR00282 family)